MNKKWWYPRAICEECAIECGGKIIKNHIATYYEVTCDVCLQKKVCTEPRDYNYPNQNKLIKKNAKVRAQITMGLKDVGNVRDL
jgi:hypothetical protein